MTKKLVSELKTEKEQISQFTEFKSHDKFQDILKSKVTENFAVCRKKMDVLYMVYLLEN